MSSPAHYIRSIHTSFTAQQQAAPSPWGPPIYSSRRRASAFSSPQPHHKLFFANALYNNNDNSNNLSINNTSHLVKFDPFADDPLPIRTVVVGPGLSPLAPSQNINLTINTRPIPPNSNSRNRSRQRPKQPQPPRSRSPSSSPPKLRQLPVQQVNVSRVPPPPGLPLPPSRLISHGTLQANAPPFYPKNMQQQPLQESNPIRAPSPLPPNRSQNRAGNPPIPRLPTSGNNISPPTSPPRTPDQTRARPPPPTDPSRIVAGLLLNRVRVHPRPVGRRVVPTFVGLDGEKRRYVRSRLSSCLAVGEDLGDLDIGAGVVQVC